jgi:hypothetical protein
LLEEQEHLVLHDAASAVAEFDRAMLVAQTTAARLDAARTQLAAVSAAYEADKAPLDLLLEAQRLLADAESRHFRSLAEYAVAIKNVHYSKGTLLDYDGVVLSESGWPEKAYADATRREATRGKPRPLNYVSARAPLISEGAYDQAPLDRELIPLGEPVEEELSGPLPEEALLQPPSIVQPPNVGPSEQSVPLPLTGRG